MYQESITLITRSIKFTDKSVEKTKDKTQL